MVTTWLFAVVALKPGELINGTLMPGELIAGALIPGELMLGTLIPGELMAGFVCPFKKLVRGTKPGEDMGGELAG